MGTKQSRTQTDDAKITQISNLEDRNTVIDSNQTDVNEALHVEEYITDSPETCIFINISPDSDENSIVVTEYNSSLDIIRKTYRKFARKPTDMGLIRLSKIQWILWTGSNTELLDLSRPKLLPYDRGHTTKKMGSNFITYSTGYPYIDNSIVIVDKKMKQVFKLKQHLFGEVLVLSKTVFAYQTEDHIIVQSIENGTLYRIPSKMKGVLRGYSVSNGRVLALFTSQTCFVIQHGYVAQRDIYDDNTMETFRIKNALASSIEVNGLIFACTHEYNNKMYFWLQDPVTKNRTPSVMSTVFQDQYESNDYRKYCVSHFVRISKNEILIFGVELHAERGRRVTRDQILLATISGMHFDIQLYSRLDNLKWVCPMRYYEEPTEWLGDFSVFIPTIPKRFHDIIIFQVN